MKKSSSSDAYSSSSFRFGDDDVDDDDDDVGESCNRFFSAGVTIRADGDKKSSPRRLVSAAVVSTFGGFVVVANIYKVNVFIKCVVFTIVLEELLYYIFVKSLLLLAINAQLPFTH